MRSASRPASASARAAGSPSPHGERDQEVLGLDLLGAQAPRDVERADDGPAALAGEALKHRVGPCRSPRAFRRLACFLCTAWRLTPSAAATSRHDQPVDDRPLDLTRFEPVGEPAQRDDGGEPLGRILRNGLFFGGYERHVVNGS